MTLRSETKMILNLLLWLLLLQEILTQAHQFPAHNHNVLNYNENPSQPVSTRRKLDTHALGCFDNPYRPKSSLKFSKQSTVRSMQYKEIVLKSINFKYGNWHHLQTVQWLLLIDGSFKWNLLSMMKFWIRGKRILQWCGNTSVRVDGMTAGRFPHKDTSRRMVSNHLIWSVTRQNQSQVFMKFVE